jgi:hypothetical protein
MKSPLKKACHICGESKTISNYYKSKDEYLDGSINWCKICILMYHQMRKEKKKYSKYNEPPMPKEGFKVEFD